MQCDAVAERLPELAEPGSEPSRRTRAHLSRCLACQAELARYRRLRRSCRLLESAPVEVPDGFVEDVLAAVDGGTGRSEARRLRRSAYLAVAATAAAAGAGALVLGRRRSHA